MLGTLWRGQYCCCCCCCCLQPKRHFCYFCCPLPLLLLLLSYPSYCSQRQCCSGGKCACRALVEPFCTLRKPMHHTGMHQDVYQQHQHRHRPRHGQRWYCHRLQRGYRVPIRHTKGAAATRTGRIAPGIGTLPRMQATLPRYLGRCHRLRPPPPLLQQQQQQQQQRRRES